MAKPSLPPALTQDEIDRLARELLSDPARFDALRRSAEADVAHGPVLVLTEQDEPPAHYSGLVVVFDSTPDPDSVAWEPALKLSPAEQSDVSDALSTLDRYIAPEHTGYNLHEVEAMAKEAGSRLGFSDGMYVLSNDNGAVRRRTLAEIVLVLRTSVPEPTTKPRVRMVEDLPESAIKQAFEDGKLVPGQIAPDSVGRLFMAASDDLWNTAPGKTRDRI